MEYRIDLARYRKLRFAPEGKREVALALLRNLVENEKHGEDASHPRDQPQFKKPKIKANPFEDLADSDDEEHFEDELDTYMSSRAVDLGNHGYIQGA